MKRIQLFLLIGSFLLPSFMTAQVSGITDVSLTFTPTAGGTAIVATATDNGQGLVVSGPIDLMESTDYDLSIGLMAGTTDLVPTIQTEGTSYLFYFAFTDSVLTSPAGDGNIDMRADPMNYEDMDANGLPIGLASSWGTECGDIALAGDFRVLLAFQAGTKTDTSASTDGTTVIDLTWTLNVAQDPNAPPCENEEEIITDVTLAFVPAAGGDTIFATATDPDGPGPLDLVVDSAISLVENTEYSLSLKLLNAIEGEDITEEIMEEDDEHMFFFAWTGDLFSDPAGDGNADNRADIVNYNDMDENSLPVGLSTQWTTSSSVSGDFRVVLKHQPDIKSATSTINDGDSDIDLTFMIGTITSIPSLIQDSKSLNLWPNPARDIVRWEIESLERKADNLQVLDMYGRVVLDIDEPQQEILVSRLAKGTYMFIIDQDNKRWAKRFVKID